MVGRPRLDTALNSPPAVEENEPGTPIRGRRPRANSLKKSLGSAPADADSQSLLSRIGRRSRSRPRSTHAPSSYQPPSVHTPEEPAFPNVSVFRFANLIELHVWSQSVTLTRPPGYEVPRSLPVFDSHSKIQGTVLLDAGLMANPGRLTISLEGVFVYISPPSTANKVSGKIPPSGMHRHTFFMSSMVVPVERPGLTRQRSSSSIREAISSAVAARQFKRRASQSSVGGSLRSFPFTLEVPPAGSLSEELPPTFSAVVEGMMGPRGRTYVERSEITYKLVATWESDDDIRTTVEAPVIFESDQDFESLDGRSHDKGSWLEVPLQPERPVPYICAIAIPEISLFPRSSAIPYYVVFTTMPRSATLAREIVLDATVTVALVRQLNIETSNLLASPDPSSPSLSSPALTNASSTSLSSGSDDAKSFILAHKTRLLRRMVNSAPPRLPRKGLRLPFPGMGHRSARSEVVAPLVEPEPEGYSDERTLFTDVYAGFPKRPKPRTEPGQKHPSMIAHALLPDGLYKSQMRLNRQMMPSMHWADLSVKYYLDVSVVFGQDESRARIPIRLS